MLFPCKWKPQSSNLDLSTLNFGEKIPSQNLGVTPATRMPYMPSGWGKMEAEWRAGLHWETWKLNTLTIAVEWTFLDSFKKCFLVKNTVNAVAIATWGLLWRTSWDTYCLVVDKCIVYLTLRIQHHFVFGFALGGFKLPLVSSRSVQSFWRAYKKWCAMILRIIFFFHLLHKWNTDGILFNFLFNFLFGVLFGLGNNLALWSFMFAFIAKILIFSVLLSMSNSL